MFDRFRAKKISGENGAEPQKKKPRLKEYVDTTDTLTNRSLKFSEWYFKHKIALGKIGMRLLFGVSALLVVFSVYGWGRYFFFDYPETERILFDLTQYNIDARRHIARAVPQELSIIGVNVFEDGPGRYDFYARIRNTNTRWKAIVTYRFFYSGGQTDSATVTVLPLTEQLMVSIGVQVPNYPGSARVEIGGITWKRIDPHAVADTASFLEERLVFEAGNFEFFPARKSEGIFAHTIMFDLTNKTVYSYWQPYFYVLYKNNGTPVGFARFEADRFVSGQTRTIELASLADTLRVTEIELIPSLDVFDEAVYMPPAL